MDYRVKLFNQMVKDTSNLEIIVTTLQDSSDERKKINNLPIKFPTQKIHSKRFLFFYINPFNELDKILEDNDLIVISDNMPNIISTSYIVLKSIMGKENKLILWSELFEKKPKDIRISIKYLLNKMYTSLLSRASRSTLKFAKSSINGYEIPQAHDSIVDLQQTSLTRYKAKKTIGLMGDYSRRKNFEPLLEFIYEKNLDYQIIVAGNWCEGITRHYKNLFKDKNASLDFRGFVESSNKKSFFQDIDCLVVTSLYEPWCLVVNEAIFNKCPVLCSSYAGVSESLPSEFILKDNYDGFDKQLDAVVEGNYIDFFERFSEIFSIENSSLKILESINESIKN